MKDADGMTTEEILGAIAVGQLVYDGCMRIETNPFSEPPLSIPIDLIRRIDPGELFLLRTREDLRRDDQTRDGRPDDR